MARYERAYRFFLRVTKRLSDSQTMAVLAIVVGVLAGLGTYLFEVLLHTCIVYTSQRPRYS